MDGIVRNAIAAIAVIVTLGSTLGGVVLRTQGDIALLQNSVTVLQTQVTNLATAFNKFRCSVKPSYDC